MGKPPPQSRLVREKTVAFAEAKDDKKKKADDKKPDDASAKPDEISAKPDDKKPDDASAKPDDKKPDAPTSDETRPYDKADDAVQASADTQAKPDDKKPDDKKPDDKKPDDKKPDDDRPIVAVSSPRAHTETMAMPSELGHGKPPELPTKPPPAPPVTAGDVESPTNMPVPKSVPDGAPDDPALPPGRVPPGDSRSLRKAGEFSLVYRMGTFVISRTGTIGKRGVWRVVEYPTSSAASHGYAKECSRFISDGFSDYRD